VWFFDIPGGRQLKPFWNPNGSKMFVELMRALILNRKLPLIQPHKTRVIPPITAITAYF
jgi:hypothetical protein